MQPQGEAVIEHAGRNDNLIPFGLGRELRVPRSRMGVTIPPPPYKEQVTPMCFGSGAAAQEKGNGTMATAFEKGI